MRILLTGCAGFIGWKLAELLMAQGHSVFGIDNLNEAYDPRLKYWRLQQLQTRPHFQFRRADITDRLAMDEVFQATFGSGGGEAAGVINLGGRAGIRASLDNPWVYYDVNVTGTINLLEACRRHQVGKFILASSSSVYGDRAVRPFKETAATDRPISPYAASKKAAEEICYTYHRIYGLDVTVLRYFTVYGPGGRPDMVLFRLIQWISEGLPVTVFGDGLQSRDFTYVDDVARGTILALQPLGYDVVNLGSDRPVVLMDVIRLVEEAVDRKAAIQFKPRHAVDLLETWADIAKAQATLGWRPDTRIEQGIQNSVAWYKQNRDWAKAIRTD